MTYNEISSRIIKAAIDMHRELGPGLLETVYQRILFYELGQSGLHVEKEVPVPLLWKKERIETGFRADLLVEDKVIVELKSVEKITPVFQKQLLSYLRLADKRLGLLLNFGEETLKDGIYRVVNNLDE